MTQAYPGTKTRTVAVRTDTNTSVTKAQTESLYDIDFYSWACAQAELIKAGQLDAADMIHIAEELETLGRSERSALESAYRLICLHQLKRRVQPDRAGSRSWTQTIVRERLHALRILEDNPGLTSHAAAAFERAYTHARKEAATETRMSLSSFPQAPPFTLEDIMNEDFWAGPASRPDVPRPTR